MLLLACLSLLSSPDAALKCAFHNPDLSPIAAVDYGTPHNTPRRSADPGPDLDYFQCAPITPSHPVCIPGDPPDSPHISL